MFQSDPSLKDMTIISKGNNSVNYGVLLDTDFFELPDSFTEMINVTIIASGGAANYGVYNSLISSHVMIKQSTIMGTKNSVYTERGETLISSTQLDGSIGGNTICAGVYDEDFIFYANTCP
jgi:hypothetical protein